MHIFDQNRFGLHRTLHRFAMTAGKQKMLRKSFFWRTVEANKDGTIMGCRHTFRQGCCSEYIYIYIYLKELQMGGGGWPFKSSLK